MRSRARVRGSDGCTYSACDRWGTLVQNVSRHVQSRGSVIAPQFWHSDTCSKSGSAAGSARQGAACRGWSGGRSIGISCCQAKRDARPPPGCPSVPRLRMDRRGIVRSLLAPLESHILHPFRHSKSSYRCSTRRDGPPARLDLQLNCRCTTAIWSTSAESALNLFLPLPHWRGGSDTKQKMGVYLRPADRLVALTFINIVWILPSHCHPPLRNSFSDTRHTTTCSRFCCSPSYPSSMPKRTGRVLSSAAAEVFWLLAVMPPRRKPRETLVL